MLLDKMKCIAFFRENNKMVSFLTHKQSFFHFIGRSVFVSRDHKLRNSSRIYVRTLLYLLYINDIPQAQSDSHTHRYGDDSSKSYQHMDIAEKENILNKERTNMCEGLFSREKKLAELNRIYYNNGLNQFQMEEYLDANLSGESMAVNPNLCIGISVQSYSSYIEPLFDYECVSWYSLLSKKIRKKIQIIQNKCICFCLKCNSRHIGAKEFKKINWQ